MTPCPWHQIRWTVLAAALALVGGTGAWFELPQAVWITWGYVLCIVTAIASDRLDD